MDTLTLESSGNDGMAEVDTARTLVNTLIADFASAHTAVAEASPKTLKRAEAKLQAVREHTLSTAGVNAAAMVLESKVDGDKALYVKLHIAVKDAGGSVFGTWKSAVDDRVRELHKVAKTDEPIKVNPVDLDYIASRYSMMRSSGEIFIEDYREPKFISTGALYTIEQHREEAVNQWLQSPPLGEGGVRRMYDRINWDPGQERVFKDRDGETVRNIYRHRKPFSKFGTAEPGKIPMAEADIRIYWEIIQEHFFTVVNQVFGFVNHPFFEHHCRRHSYKLRNPGKRVLGFDMFIGDEGIGKGVLTEGYTASAYAPYDAEKAGAAEVINLATLLKNEHNDDLLGIEYAMMHEFTHPTGKGTTRDLTHELKALGDKKSVWINPKFLKKFKARFVLFPQMTVQYPSLHIEAGIRRRVAAWIWDGGDRNLDDRTWQRVIDIYENPDTAELVHFATRYFLEIAVPQGFFTRFIGPHDEAHKRGAYAGGFRDERRERELDSHPVDDNGALLLDQDGNPFPSMRDRIKSGQSVMLVSFRDYERSERQPSTDIRDMMEDNSGTKTEKKVRKYLEELRDDRDGKEPSPMDWIADEVELAERAGVLGDDNGEAIAARILGEAQCYQPRMPRLVKGKQKGSQAVRVTWTHGDHEDYCSPYAFANVSFWMVQTPETVRDSFKKRVMKPCLQSRTLANINARDPRNASNFWQLRRHRILSHSKSSYAVIRLVILSTHDGFVRRQIFSLESVTYDITDAPTHFSSVVKGVVGKISGDYSTIFRDRNFTQAMRRCVGALVHVFSFKKYRRIKANFRNAANAQGLCASVCVGEHIGGENAAIQHFRRV